MKKILLLIYCLCVSFSVFAFPQMADLFPGDSDIPERLEKGEEVTLFHNQEFVPQLVPESPFSQALLQKVEQLKPNMAIEGVFMLPLSDEERDPVDVLNTLSAVSTLEGLQYYSASRDEVRLLFEESYIVDNPEDMNPQEDPVFSDLPSSVSLTIYQKDLTFKNNVSSYDLFSDGEMIYLEQTNLTPMRYEGFLRVIAPENFQTRLLVLPCEEGWLYYGIMAADTLNIKAFKERANNSFYNRMIALYNWFLDTYNSDN